MAEPAPAALAPPPGCPIGWQPSALAPVFYGFRHFNAGQQGAPAKLRVFYPSLNGAPDNAPILSGCGRYPVVLFAHGACEGEDETQYLKWFRLPSQLARSGYVVVVPQLVNIGDPVHNSPATQQTLTGALAWVRQSWEHRLTLLPAPATGLAGHSRGAVHVGNLAARNNVAALASISGVWGDWPASAGPKPINQGTAPRLLTWGSETVSEGDAEMSNQAWSLVPKPKHRAVFSFAEHYDYLYNQPLPCRVTGLGPCPHVGLATDDLVTMFFANYLPPELWPDLPGRVPNNLIPPPLNLTPEQRFYAGGHLVGMTTFNAAAQCTVAVTVELPLDKTVPMVVEMTQPLAAQQVQSAGLVAKFTGPTSPGVPWVSAQSPIAGTRVTAGSTVSMTLRVGPIP